jgi:hypothetical protein
VEQSVSAQLTQFFLSLALGLPLGLLYDVMRVFRRRARRRFLSVVCDFLFPAVCFAAAFWFAMTISGGQVRFYNLAGTAFGGALYGLLLSPYVCCVGDILADVLLFFLRVALWPLRCAAVFTKIFCRNVKILFLYQKKGVKIKSDIQSARRHWRSRRHFARRGSRRDEEKEKSEFFSQSSRGRSGRLLGRHIGAAADRTQRTAGPPRYARGGERPSASEERGARFLFRV